jgi:hypothetical protein
MSKQARAAKSTGLTARRSDPLAQARKILVQGRDHLLAQAQELDRVLERLDSLQPAPAASQKKTIKQLFDARDRTPSGSKEEERATERILESVFPDTNAD